MSTRRRRVPRSVPWRTIQKCSSQNPCSCFDDRGTQGARQGCQEPSGTQLYGALSRVSYVCKISPYYGSRKARRITNADKGTVSFKSHVTERAHISSRRAGAELPKLRQESNNIYLTAYDVRSSENILPFFRCLLEARQSRNVHFAPPNVA